MNFKSKEEIEIEFTRANDQAEELEQIALELSNIAKSDVENAMVMLSGNYRGDNGRLFVAKGKTLTHEIYETADDLLKVAKSIRETADIIYRAEKMAINIF